ncbi:MAG: hypothetical protein ACRC1J_04595, partial [Sandaracinobacteroides sp.]
MTNSPISAANVAAALPDEPSTLLSHGVRRPKLIRLNQQPRFRLPEPEPAAKARPTEGAERPGRSLTAEPAPPGQQLPEQPLPLPAPADPQLANLPAETGPRGGNPAGLAGSDPVVSAVAEGASLATPGPAGNAEAKTDEPGLADPAEAAGDRASSARTRWEDSRRSAEPAAQQAARAEAAAQQAQALQAQGLGGLALQTSGLALAHPASSGAGSARSHPAPPQPGSAAAQPGARAEQRSPASGQGDAGTARKGSSSPQMLPFRLDGAQGMPSAREGAGARPAQSAGQPQAGQPAEAMAPADIRVAPGRDAALNVSIAAGSPELRDRISAAEGELRAELARIGTDVDMIQVELRGDSSAQSGEAWAGREAGGADAQGAGVQGAGAQGAQGFETFGPWPEEDRRSDADSASDAL